MIIDFKMITSHLLLMKNLSVSVRLMLLVQILSSIIESGSAVKIANLIPDYCNRNFKLSQTQIKTIALNTTDVGQSSVLNVVANILNGTEIPENYECYLIVTSPPNTGLILTSSKQARNKDDSIEIRTGSNPNWKVLHDPFENGSASKEFDEIITLPSEEFPSSLTIKYVPTAGVTPFNVGFQMAITVYREKDIHCGEDFDCNNGRCISSSLQCNGYDNCGNMADEYHCPGNIGWWMTGMLIPIAIIVLVLAIFVWIRMSKA